MAKAGTKLSPEKEAALSGELSIQQKYDLVQTLMHPRMNHVETIFITADGKYHFSAGTELSESKPLDAVKDAEAIRLTGKKVRTIKLPGTYINRSKVVDEIAVEDFMEDKEDIVEEYTKYLKEQREVVKASMVANPDATAEMLAEMFRTAAKPNTEVAKLLAEIKRLIAPAK